MNEVIINELRSKVFMDADVAIAMGKPPGNWIFQRLVDLVNLGLISIVTTDVTMGQIIKHHVKDAYETLASFTPVPLSQRGFGRSWYRTPSQDKCRLATSSQDAL